ncbi:MAG: hypothetical protein M3Y87_00890 [Myxococcota bacterium]|nr:hypothetical protein [Myxococcota bacterium]
MADNALTPPYSTHVKTRVEYALEKWARGGATERPLLGIFGQPGTGKTSVLRDVAARARTLQLPVVHLSPPELDLDAAGHLVGQLAGALRGAQENGALDPVFQLHVPLAEKIDVLERALRRRDDLVVILDVPESWSDRSNEQTQSDRMLSDAWDALSRFAQAAAGRHALIIAAARPRDVLPNIALEQLVPNSPASTLLGDHAQWGRFATEARELGEALGEQARELTPLSLRIAIALRALDRSTTLVLPACYAGFRQLRTHLVQELSARPRLRHALDRIARARYAIPRDVARSLVGSIDVRERDLIETVLLLQTDQGLELHSELRSAVAESERMPAPARMDDRLGAHATLARSFPRIDRISSWRDAFAVLEGGYHAAGAGDETRVRETALDLGTLETLGRTLGIAGRYDQAIAVYEHVLSIDRERSYSAEYLAYNLDRANRDTERGLELFQRAVALEEGNPWWNRRLVQAYLRRGRLAEAEVAWRNAETAIARGERSPDAAWLATHFHLGIANDVLERGALSFARAVLENVPSSLREHGELALLWNQLLHREEAERLGIALFPESIPFETRWETPPFGEAPREGEVWYPGQISGVDERVVRIHVGRREDDAVATYEIELEQRRFLEAANMRDISGTDIGRFVAIIARPDDTLVISLAARGTSSRRAAALDLLRRWSPPAHGG